MQIKVGSGGTLRRALGTFDLVLLNIVTIIGLRWLSTAAQIGPSSLTLWGVALLTFFVPSALAVLELSSRIPRRRRSLPMDHGGAGRHARVCGRMGLLAFEPGVFPLAAAVCLGRLPAHGWAFLDAPCGQSPVQRNRHNCLAVGGDDSEFGGSYPGQVAAESGGHGDRGGCGVAAGGWNYGLARTWRQARPSPRQV